MLHLQWGCFLMLPDVAASTISKLYEAQRQPAHPEPFVPSEPLLPSSTLPVQRSTLHSFWNINSARPATTHMMLDPHDHPLAGTKMRCEDCDMTLRLDDAMEIDVGVVEQETACFCCRRRVCDRCAVLGKKRVCLACATSGR